MKRALIRLSLVLMALISWPSVAQVDISVAFGPPPLPVYAQPPCPDDGYLWTPGYWAYDNYFGYYWVPGTWVLAPQPGLLWTPGWWGWNEGAFLFHGGYWAPHVGFYGGINYGFGFFGEGYEGGRWDGNHFYYNRAVSNINVTNIHNVYNTKVVTNVTVNHISYNGSNGGIEARPTREQQEVAQQPHVAPQPAQLHHLQLARANPQLRAEVNHGKPAIAATVRPAVFTGSHVVGAQAAGGVYQAPERKLDHASSVSPHQAPLALHQSSPALRETHETPPSPQANQAGRAPRKEQQQEHQEKQARELVDRQNEQHAQLQARQQRDHEQAQQKNLDAQHQQQMEQHHSQQTAQMEQQHMQQMQHLERPPANRAVSNPHPEPKPPNHER